MKKTFYVPDSLDLASRLEAKGYPARYAKPVILDKFHYLIDSLYLRKILTSHCEWTDFLPVNAKTLEEIVTPQWCKDVKDTLVDLGVLEYDIRSGYTIGESSKSYRFTEPFRGGRFRSVEISKKSLALKIENHRREHSARVVHQHEGRELIARSVETLTCDFEGARNYVEGTVWLLEGKEAARRHIINLFENREFYVTADARGRFYHLFTSLPRDLRPFFTYRGKTLHAIDVGNCQPLLLCTLYKGDSREHREYQHLVENNRFYATMNELLPEPFDLQEEAEKKRFKEKLFEEVTYGPNRRDERVLMRAFRRKFPELARRIWDKKQGQYSQLALHLQELEAELVIDTVALEFARRHRGEDVCLVSVHDCLISTEEHVDELREMMRHEFQTRFNLNAPLDVKELVRETDSEDLALAA